jgi:ubiquinone/menaquinone biosynthesis C-methylase UbiE
MIARATKKAARRGVAVAFEVARAESLPFPGGSVSVVLSTVMLHHLRRSARQECLREAHRVLVPGGRLLVVDFGRVHGGGHGLFAHFHRRAGRISATCWRKSPVRAST